MTFKTDWQNGNTGHIVEHNLIGQHLNKNLAINGTKVALGGATIHENAINSVAVGGSTDIAVAPRSVAIGYDVTVSDPSNSSGEAVAVGTQAQVTAWRGVAIGFKAIAAGISATALGRGAKALFTHSIALGRGAFTTLAGQLSLGFQGGNTPQHVYFDNGHSSKYTEPTDGGTVDRTPTSCPVVLHGMAGKDTTETPTNDRAGGHIILAGGQGTGTAVGGSVKLQTAPAGGVSNNTENALADRVIVDSTGDVEIVADGKGLILSSANGTRYRLTVDNDGNLVTTAL